MNEVLNLIPFLMLSVTIMILVIIIFPISFYNFYYIFKLYSYLRKNRPDILKYALGSDLTGFERITNRRLLQWYFSDMDEEDETIRRYKSKLKGSVKVMYKIFTLIIILIVVLLLALFIIPTTPHKF